MDMLSRLSHDSDQEVAQNAILALGVTLLPSSMQTYLSNKYALGNFLGLAT